MNQEPDVRAAKRALRRELVASILGLDPAARRRQEQELVARFDALPGFAEAATVLLYATAFPEEIDTSPLICRTLDLGKRLILPRVDRARRALALHEITDPATDLGPGVMGIPEPPPGRPEFDPGAIDWALVPGLGFDPRGFRLGRGAGHYDRLLPRLRPDAPCWALALEPQWVEDLPVEPHDQPLDGVAGPGRTVRGSRGA